VGLVPSRSREPPSASSDRVRRLGDRATGSGGRLHRIHLGVYAVGHTVLNRNARYLAAVLAAGDGAVLSHRSAAILWGIHRSDAARIDVTVPRTCGFRSTKAIACTGRGCRRR
jgi:predicted transcriptional regulator of viral defense system